MPSQSIQYFQPTQYTGNHLLTYSLFEEVLALFCLKMTGLMELTGNFDVLSGVAKQSKRAT